MEPAARGGRMELKQRLSEEERRVLETYVKLRRAVNTLHACESENMRNAGLTESQFGVLEALEHLGPMCQKDLARKILRSAGNLTTVVGNLEQRCLVKRHQSPDDRRVSTVELTDSGRRLIRSIFPDHAAALVDAFSVLTAEELEFLGVLCKKLGTQRPDGHRALLP